MKKEDNINYEKTLFWQRAKFWVRVVYLTAILIALIFVFVRAGGDPCERCVLRVDNSIDDGKWEDSYNCREIMEEFVYPNFDFSVKPREYTEINKSKVEEYFITKE